MVIFDVDKVHTYIPTYFENDKKSYFSAIFDGFLENFDKI